MWLFKWKKNEKEKYIIAMELGGKKLEDLNMFFADETRINK